MEIQQPLLNNCPTVGTGLETYTYTRTRRERQCYTEIERGTQRDREKTQRNRYSYTDIERQGQS